MSFFQFTEVASIYQSVRHTVFSRDRLNCHPSKTEKIIQMAYRGLAVSSLGILVMACAACGGGGGGNPASNAATQLPPKPIEVAAMGDSTMAGVVKNADGTYTVTNAPIADLQTDLQAQIGSNVTVTNRSVTGGTTRNALDGNGGFSTTLAQYLATLQSKVVIENYGINDFAGGSTSAEQYRTDLQQMVDTIKSFGMVPVLEEPNPICDPARDPAQNVEAVNAQGQTISVFVDVINQVAQKNGLQVVHQYSMVKALPNWCAMLSDHWAHPTTDLYAIKARNDAVILASLVKAMQ